MSATTTASTLGRWARGRVERARTGAGTMGELVTFLVATGRWWLVPMVAVFLASGVVMGIVHLIEYAAPFVYTIF